jgi:TfoX/Sxy family transcriptional regulator of competence genes
MSYDEKTAERIRQILADRPDVVEIRMFGGLCFMVNDHMCCGLTSVAFMVRVGRERFAEAVAQPHARPMDFSGRPAKGVVYVDAPGYRTKAQLTRWIQRGIDFVSTAPPKKKRPTPKRPRPRRRS